MRLAKIFHTGGAVHGSVKITSGGDIVIFVDGLNNQCIRRLSRESLPIVCRAEDKIEDSTARLILRVVAKNPVRHAPFPYTILEGCEVVLSRFDLSTVIEFGSPAKKALAKCLASINSWRTRTTGISEEVVIDTGNISARIGGSVSRE